MARVLAKSGPGRPLAPVLSVGALEAMVRLPAQLSRVRSARVVRLLSGAPPRQLLALRADGVVFDVDGRSVDLVLPALAASGTWPAVPAGTIRLEAGRTIVDYPVEAMRALAAAAPADGDLFDHKVL